MRGMTELLSRRSKLIAGSRECVEVREHRHLSQRLGKASSTR